MKCPLLIIANFLEAGRNSPTEVDCLQAECAWWDKVQSQCVALSVGDWLENIHSILSGVLNKMPHEA